MSTLKVNTIQDTTGNDALTIDSSGNVTASQGFVPSTQLSHRNLIINGAMQVAQRGTSQSAAGYNSIDRLGLSLSGATATMTQESFTTGQTDVPSRFRKFARIDTTTGDNYCGIYHRVEDVDIVEGQVTLSFYAKGTNPDGGSFDVFPYQSFGSGGSSAVVITAQDLTVTSSWQRFNFVFTLPSLSGKTVGTGSYIELNICQPVGDTGTGAWTLDITGVQLEVGSVATPFEHRSYGEELARCQRYYSTLGRTGYMSGRGNGTTSVSDCLIPASTVMRTSPTITGGTWYMTKGSGTTLYNGTGETYSVNSVSSQGIVVDINNISNGTDNMVEVIQVLSVTLDAEL